MAEKVEGPYPEGDGRSPTLRVVPGKGPRVWLRVSLIAASGSALIAVLLVASLRHARSGRAPASSPMLTRAATEAPLAREGPVRILCGYTKQEYIDSAGKSWNGDRFFNGGGTGTSPRRLFYRTRDPEVFTTSRSGDFSYAIPLKPGDYELRLYFAETDYGPGTVNGEGEGSRRFHVDLNGMPLLRGFDPYADSGGNWIADARVFRDVKPASDGYLHLRFAKGDYGEPFLNALEIIPSVHGKLNPIRMVTQDNSFVDAPAQVWEPDHYVLGGRLVFRQDPVKETPNPGLYAGERWGVFNYTIPVAEGRYSVTLHFAETYFGSLGPGGVGSRVFDVYCNGEALMRNFDIFKESGGPDRALQKTFHGLRPNAQGKLVLAFVPVKNYACLNALEVLDESK